MSDRRGCASDDGDDRPLLGSKSTCARYMYDGSESRAAAEGVPSSPVKSPSIVTHIVTAFLIPFGDEAGSISNVALGMLAVLGVGTAAGIIMPKDADLPTPWCRSVSSILGYTYFLCWSICFYPQVVLNYRRKTTTGLSADYSILNVIGTICYSVYTVTFFWSDAVGTLYRERFGPEAETTVQSNDVAFALHSFVLTAVTLGQICYYGPEAKLSTLVLCAIIASIAFCAAFAVLIFANVSGFGWLDFLYMLSFGKVLVTVTKYWPQLRLNIHRKSTVGWSVWGVLLDFMGGVLSMIQHVFDSMALNEWSGITGNLAKLGISLVTLFYDTCFLVQHFILYRNAPHENQPFSRSVDE